MLLLDLTHTSHTRALTGIQRQARGVFCALEKQTETCAICFDPFAAAWRPLDAAELILARGVLPGGTGSDRGTAWPLSRKLGGLCRRLLNIAPELPPARGLVCPEIFSPRIAARLPALLSRVHGPRVAFFFDTIPLTHPEHTPAKTVARFPAYLRELLAFDGIAANSQTTAANLLGYWRWLGVANPPEISVLPLGVDKPPPPTNTTTPGSTPRVLSVGTIEGRKNHLALLAAAETLWDEGRLFELQLVGLPRPETAAAALAQIARLQAAGRPLRFEGVLSPEALDAAWRACSFTVYPSLIEGFGLPVIESLSYGKPCICTATGATGELVVGGGVVGVAPPDASGFATAMRELIDSPARLAALAVQTRQRTLPTWDDSARHLLAWMSGLRRR